MIKPPLIFSRFLFFFFLPLYWHLYSTAYLSGLVLGDIGMASSRRHLVRLSLKSVAAVCSITHFQPCRLLAGWDKPRGSRPRRFQQRWYPCLSFTSLAYFLFDLEFFFAQNGGKDHHQFVVVHYLLFGLLIRFTQWTSDGLREESAKSDLGRQRIGQSACISQAWELFLAVGPVLSTFPKTISRADGASNVLTMYPGYPKLAYSLRRRKSTTRADRLFDHSSRSRLP